MNTPPIGWFRCKNLAGEISLGFHCGKCRLVIYRGITERGVHHCGAWEKPPLHQGTLAVHQVQIRDQRVVDCGPVSSVLVGFD